MTAEQKKEYGQKLRNARINMGLNLRDVAIGMRIDVSELSRLERGDEKLPELEVMRDIEIDAMCHRCGDAMKAHPIKGIVFPAYVCKVCRDKEAALDES